MSANVSIKEYLNTRLMLREKIIKALASGDPPGWKRLFTLFSQADSSRFNKSSLSEIEIYHNTPVNRAEAFLDFVGGLVGYTVSVMANAMAKCNLVDVALELYPELPRGRYLTINDLEPLTAVLEKRVIDITLLMISYCQMHNETRLNNNSDDARTLAGWLIQYQNNDVIKQIFNEYAQRSGLSAWIIA